MSLNMMTTGHKVNKNDNPFIRHQITIAKSTLKMPDAILGVMGGMTKEEARKILLKYGEKI